MKQSTFIWIVIVIIILAIGGWYWSTHNNAVPGQASANTPIATVDYICDQGKAIHAVYYQGESKPAASADQPPQPGGSVMITLSDGRTMTLPQTISADGARYANPDESFVFWSKGTGAFVMENDAQTYANCEEGGAATSTASTSDSAAAPAGDGTGVNQNLILGVSGTDSHLTAYNGMAVYTYDRDTDGTSACTGSCAENWPPYTVPSADAINVSSVISGEVGTIARTDGELQVTYNGKPLYFYAGDTTTADTKGDGVGGVWHLVQR